jgi:hypothetical protein
MKEKIFKYEITDKKQMVLIPKDAEILSCQIQNENVCVWALVNPQKENEEKYFECYATGEEMHQDMGIQRKFLNTVQFKNGLVFHIFERID